MTAEIQAQIDEQQQNLLLAQEKNDLKAQLEIWCKLGRLYRELRNYQHSLSAYQQAATIAEQLNDAYFLMTIGVSFSALSEYSQSIDCLKKSIQISLEQTDTEQDALTSIHFLAGRYKDFLHDIPQAIVYYQQELDLARKTNNTRHQYWSLRELGDCAEKSDDPQLAIDYYEKALLVARQDNDKSGETTLLTDIAMIFASLHDLIQMNSYFEQALIVAKVSEDTSDSVSVLIRWGRAYREQNDLETGTDYYHRALALAQEHDDIDHISTCLSILARLSEKQGNLKEAIDLYKQEVEVLRADRLKSPENHKHGFRHFSYTNALESLGKLYEEMGDTLQALNYMEQAFASTTMFGHTQHLNEDILRLKQKLNSTENTDI